ncbi:MAG: SxtJ family membrane protein, partial [Myxococcota bacterium]|nr:SxtJ family membrane protein [Myxococcota bacterium]
VVYGLTGALDISQIIWGVAGVITLVFFAIKPLQVPIYLGWIYLAFPIGWTVSHVLMMFVYYLVLTPFGIVMRLIGRDPMFRRFDKSATSYFVDHEAAETGRYFKQF